MVAAPILLAEKERDGARDQMICPRVLVRDHCSRTGGPEDEEEYMLHVGPLLKCCFVGVRILFGVSGSLWVPGNDLPQSLKTLGYLMRFRSPKQLWVFFGSRPVWTKLMDFSSLEF
ncbi:hypothetical protein RchiOBHm_Chr2g0122501 [Rosa chinensis]|uniref:Uncharacterized protein n=1 Tax=Rosa chinensis TaxID=74649 RepID=A0A2P6RST2_ROSCH|nr:hypothetical protein RchiOBHm_Chr2g0122501 [Rosa chinensis]